MSNALKDKSYIDIFPEHDPHSKYREYITAFHQTKEKHLEELWSLHQEISEDESLQPLERAIGGVTLENEHIDRYRNLARRMGNMIGEPIITINEHHVDKQMPRKDGNVKNAFGGFISGQVGVKSFSIDEKEAQAELTVPIERPALTEINYHDYPDNDYAMITNEFPEDVMTDSMIVALILKRKDYYEDFHDFAYKGGLTTEEPTVLVGREKIYQSKYFQRGISLALTALEGAYSSETEIFRARFHELN